MICPAFVSERWNPTGWWALVFSFTKTEFGEGVSEGVSPSSCIRLSCHRRAFSTRCTDRHAVSQRLTSATRTATYRTQTSETLYGVLRTKLPVRYSVCSSVLFHSWTIPHVRDADTRINHLLQVACPTTVIAVPLQMWTVTTIYT